MAKKDFSNVMETITEATQEPPKKRKPRREYTDQERQEIQAAGNTAGRKGCKLPRINLACQQDVYDYITTMSRAAGINYAKFVDTVMRQHMAEHADTYQQAIKFRASL